MGAKMLYGVLILHAPGGAAYPKQKTLQKLLGGASTRTIRRWLRELEELGLIRTKQKGRGLSNNYYFLRSNIIDDTQEAASSTPVPKAVGQVSEHKEEAPQAEYNNEQQEELARPPMPESKDYASMEEFVEAVDKWEREVRSPEWIQDRDEWLKLENEKRITTEAENKVSDEPQPGPDDFQSEQEYIRAYYDWELRVFNPSFLLEKYGAEALHKSHGVEVCTLEGGMTTLRKA